MENVKKIRLDVLLVERGLFETREKAKRSIMAGLVFSGTERLEKAGEKVKSDIDLHVKGQLMPYVGRGGFKMEKALQVFDFDVTGKTGLDIGSSTGGFTDCSLQNGAAHMYALDVGSNQLDWKLRSDDRVTVMEKTNFRHATPDMFSVSPQFATIDVSFISLRLMLPPLKTILVEGGDVMALVKPQFEAGRDDIGKKGIVRDERIHIRVLDEMIEFFIQQGFYVKQLDYSPITGGEGNIEFLLHARLGQPGLDASVNAVETVKRAHASL
ncbi:RNA methyltransferase [Exiguobacterium sp. BMC-KP]|uniref:TlyA family RNA methyltransferase n=1 Tax=Exiguobacterium sp. BMC-KP TaxID=1684312 RepID=UPI0006AA4BD3|nr:TlyA family RNA methyltransferase [Exiguobacterium sp. BMC-KP]KOP28646.1 RNA methyltransferase [Exiguobacterium sp. BMC-KP]